MPVMCFSSHIIFSFSSHHCQLPIKLPWLYANLATPGAILQENNIHRSCNLILCCSLSGNHTNTYYLHSPARRVILLVVSYLGRKALLIYLSSLKLLTNILLAVVTKKLSEIQFPFYVINLLNTEKKYLIV